MIAERQCAGRPSALVAHTSRRGGSACEASAARYSPSSMLARVLIHDGAMPPGPVSQVDCPPSPD